MPSLAELENQLFVKALLVGASGAGKTGSLASLALAGYELRIIDLDNGLPVLFSLLKDHGPEALARVQFQQFADQLTAGPTGIKAKGIPQAYPKTCAALTKWPDDGSNPAEWGPEKILVIDSLTSLGMSLRMLTEMREQARDSRQIYRAAQDELTRFLAALFNSEFRTNVLVLTQIESVDEGEYIASIGRALGLKMPRLVNNVFLYTSQGAGQNIKRQIHTVPLRAGTLSIPVKNARPGHLKPSYPQETGLAEIFEALRGPAPK